MTRRFQIDNVDPPEYVIAQSYCAEIVVEEERLAGTADYTIKTLPYGDAITISAGVPYVFRTPLGTSFVPLQKVAEIASVGATMWFVQKENG